MPEPPKKGNDGLLYGYWHILNTPCGQILKTLVDYGYKPGISTRGNGDIIEDYNGEESVDPDTYQLNALDIVLIPAVEKARLDLVESVQNKKSLKESLKELVDNSDEGAKKIMNESLAQLNITLTSENAGEAKEVSIPVDMTTDDDGNVTIAAIEDNENKNEAAINEITVTPDVIVDAQSKAEQEVETDVASEVSADDIDVNHDNNIVDDAEVSVITDLQESLKQNAELKTANEGLQNSLSVSIAKEQQLNEELSRCKKKIAELVEHQKKLIGLQARIGKFEENNKQLSESLGKVNSQNVKLNRTIALQKVNIRQLEKQNERIETKHNRQLLSLQEQLKQAQDEKMSVSDEYTSKINNTLLEAKSIKESFNQNIAILKSDNNKLSQSNQALNAKLSEMTEAYAKLKCQITGVDYRTIKESLNNKSFEDIDKLTESYTNRRLIENRLPFAKNDVKKIRYTVPSQGNYNPVNPDDIYIEQ